jgi:hypothetical protein
MRNLILGLCGLAVALTMQLAHAQAPARQFYDMKWQFNKDKGYHYKKFHYKAAPMDKEYKHQYVIFYKNDEQKKNWLYFYNPTSEKIWARYPTTHNATYAEDVKKGKELWSILPKEKRARDVYDIKADDYGKVGVTCPIVPESKDNTNMLLPPSDLP